MSYKIIGKYIKSLNFSISNAKTFFLLSKNISNYKINIDIQSNQIKEKIIEVETSLSLLPTKNESALTSKRLGCVLNLNEPLSPTNSKPTPL